MRNFFASIFEKNIIVRSLDIQDAKRLDELSKENAVKENKLISEFMDLVEKEPQLLEIMKGI